MDRGRTGIEGGEGERERGDSGRGEIAGEEG